MTAGGAFRRILLAHFTDPVMITSAPRLALALAAVLALAGCDRYAADSPGLQPGPPAAAAGQMYVKGNTALRVDVPVEFRAQFYSGITTYAWTVSGTGAASVDFAGDSRVVMLTGTRPGPAVVRVEGRSSEGRTLFTGTREIVVQ